MESKRKKILAIDDEVEILEVLREHLEAEGYEVCTANNGDAGLELAKIFNPDLIFLDVMMPKMNGFQVLERLSASPESRKTPVVMLSAHGVTDNIFAAQAYRVRDFLMKPYKIADLVDAMHRYT